jgi:hypothetical protein
MIVRRGFRAPPSYHIDRLREAPAGHFFDVMTNGFGAMASYANRIEVADRWAIVAYIRALQLSQSASVDDVPDDERDKLEPAEVGAGIPPDHIDGVTSTQRAAGGHRPVGWSPAESAVTVAAVGIGSGAGSAVPSSRCPAAESSAALRECAPAGINPPARQGETVDRIQDSIREAPP